MNDLMEWFQKFRSDYGLYFKKLKNDQDYYLAISFLEQHGFPYDISDELIMKNRNETVPWSERIGVGIAIVCGVFVYLAIASFFITLVDSDTFFGFLLACVGWAMIGVPLALLFGRR
jgi:hypothetical protein